MNLFCLEFFKKEFIYSQCWIRVVFQYPSFQVLIYFLFKLKLKGLNYFVSCLLNLMINAKLSSLLGHISVDIILVAVQ